MMMKLNTAFQSSEEAAILFFGCKGGEKRIIKKHMKEGRKERTRKEIKK
jgi:hypothetical protein